MLKKITKMGNSQGVIFDTALMDQAHLKVGDDISIAVHEGGTITITPIRPVITAENAGAKARKLIRKNSELFRRLS